MVKFTNDTGFIIILFGVIPPLTQGRQLWFSLLDSQKYPIDTEWMICETLKHDIIIGQMIWCWSTVFDHDL